MLSSRAYSVRQKSRLAISLSWIGGYTNAIALIFCARVVSHMTGATTGLAISLAHGAFAAARPFAMVVVPFFFGAITSAIMTELAKRRGHPSKYVAPVALEAVLLCAFAITMELCPATSARASVLERYYLLAAAIAAFAMGLQNATITEISGAIVRTTHLTGVITDLGLEGTQLLIWFLQSTRGRPLSRTARAMRVSQRHPSLLRIGVLASILGSFVFGAIVGTFTYAHFHGRAMLLPVAFLLFIIAVDWFYPIADIRELDPASDPELRLQGILKSLLPPELGIYRLGNPRHSRSRAPNFQPWVDRLPDHWRVIILVLSPQTRFNENAYMDLHAALEKLQSTGRSLIIAGLTAHQYKTLEALGIAQAMDIENLCPDLEFAIARGMALTQSAPV